MSTTPSTFPRYYLYFEVSIWKRGGRIFLRGVSIKYPQCSKIFVISVNVQDIFGYFYKMSKKLGNFFLQKFEFLHTFHFLIGIKGDNMLYKMKITVVR